MKRTKSLEAGKMLNRVNTLGWLLKHEYILKCDEEVLHCILIFADESEEGRLVNCTLSDMKQHLKENAIISKRSIEFIRESVDRLLDITIRIKDKNRHLNISPILGWMEDDHLNIEVSPFLKHIDKLMVPKDIRYK